MLSCDSKKNKGCKGGAVSSVLDYAKKFGLVEEDCLPYSHDSEIPCPSTLSKCKKYFLDNYCVSSTVEGIKREIKKNGPVIAVTPVYKDFLSYSSGIFEADETSPKF